MTCGGGELVRKALPTRRWRPVAGHSIRLRNPMVTRSRMTRADRIPGSEEIRWRPASRRHYGAGWAVSATLPTPAAVLRARTALPRLLVPALRLHSGAGPRVARSRGPRPGLPRRPPGAWRPGEARSIEGPVPLVLEGGLRSLPRELSRPQGARRRGGAATIISIDRLDAESQTPSSLPSTMISRRSVVITANKPYPLNVRKGSNQSSATATGYSQTGRAPNVRLI